MSTRNTIKDPNTHNALAKLPALYSTDGTKGDRPAVKLFDAYGSAFWVIWEYDAEQKLGFGLCDLGMGFPELGYVSIEELEGLGLRVERDLYANTLVEGYESRNMDIPDYLV